MSRPFRYQAPSLPAGAVARPRLTARLAERFERRLVTVVAGPGFGKTVLLAAALAENRRSPQGRDVWLSCEPADVSAPRLLGGLLVALAAAHEGADADVAAVVAEVEQLSPARVCLVLDDVHELGTDSAGARALAELVDELPANGHLLVGSRQAVPVPQGRLAAHGRLVRLREPDLVLTSEELTQFAAARGVNPAVVAGSGGWPAVAELAASAGADLVLDFLWEEVLARLGHERARLLAQLSVVGGGDSAVLAAVAGRSVSIDEVVDGVPLAARSEDGWAVLHALWAPVLRRVLPASAADEARRRAASHHRQRRRWTEAVELYAEAEAWDLVVDVLREVLHHWRSPVGPAELVRWAGLLPPAWQQEPEALLVRGLTRQASTRPRDALPLLDAAAAAYRSAGDVLGELAALGQQALVHWWSGEIAELAALYGRVAELAAAGSAEAAASVTLSEAALAHAAGDADRVLALLDSVDRHLPFDWTVTLHWLRAVAHVRHGDLGRAEDDLRPIGRWEAGAFAPTVESTQLRIAWLAGRVDEVLARSPVLLQRVERSGFTLNAVFGRLHLAHATAWLGDPAAGRRHLALVEPEVTRTAVPLTRTYLASTRAACCITEGDEDAARDELAAVVPAEEAPDALLDRLAVTWTLLPRCREALSAQPLGAAHQVALDLAHALDAARQHRTGDLTAFAWPEPGVVRAHLGLRWSAELAAAATVAGNPPPDALVTQLGPAARPILRDLATRTRDRRRAAAARTLAATFPAAPDHRLEIAVLCPLEVRRDGKVVEHPHLRRARVRALLCYLVAHRRARREEIAAALWPDHDDGGRNLRVTLNYLQNVLQPERASGDPPWFVRQDGPWLRLVDDEHLVVDAWALETYVAQGDQAAARGDQAAVDHYRAASALWRGECLADVPYADWAEPFRSHLRARHLSASLRWGDLLLADDQPAAAANAAEAALRADPWSEGAHRLLIRAHLATGDRDAARRALESCRSALEQLGLEPEPATTALQATFTHAPADAHDRRRPATPRDTPIQRA